MIPFFRRFAMTLIVLAGSGAQAGAQTGAEIPAVGSVVLFNTVCAHCHEGECSGRLSFDSGREGAEGHIRRHGGDNLGRERVDDLFSLLAFTKRECRVFAPDVPVAPGSIRNAADLARLRTPDGRAFFIPLGPLEPGTYRLDLGAGSDIRIGVQILSAGFDRLVDACFDPHGGQLEIPVTVEAAGDHFLRVQARQPLALTRMALNRVALTRVPATGADCPAD